MNTIYQIIKRLVGEIDGLTAEFVPESLSRPAQMKVYKNSDREIMTLTHAGSYSWDSREVMWEAYLCEEDYLTEQYYDMDYVDISRVHTHLTKWRNQKSIYQPEQ